MKKNSVTDIMEQMSEDEMQRIIALKSGLEDLNLVIQEIEDTYKMLADGSLTDNERKNQRLRLYTLERYLSDLNTKVNSALGTNENRHQLS